MNIGYSRYTAIRGKVIFKNEKRAEYQKRVARQKGKKKAKQIRFNVPCIDRHFNTAGYLDPPKLTLPFSYFNLPKLLHYLTKLDLTLIFRSTLLYVFIWVIT